MKILVIDDNDYAVTQISAALGSLGVTSPEITRVECSSALDELATVPFDLAFVDFFLGKERTYGIDLVGKFKAGAVVGFSTRVSASEAIAKDAEVAGYAKTAFGEKLKDVGVNPALVEVLRPLVS